MHEGGDEKPVQLDILDGQYVEKGALHAVLCHQCHLGHISMCTPALLHESTHKGADIVLLHLTHVPVDVCVCVCLGDFTN